MKKTLFLLLLISFALPSTARAGLTIDDLLSVSEQDLESHSYLVLDQLTGETILKKNADKMWVPASLTKIITALVVLDQKPDFNKICSVLPEDEVGGARINATKNAKYRLGNLLDASLVASANNATNALADCVMDRPHFVEAMNTKAVELGAKNSSFVEPSGIDPKNQTNAEDLGVITRAAFSTSKIQEITQKKSVYFTSVSRPRRVHNLKTTDILLKDTTQNVIAGKTGYLEESLYNFAYSGKVGDSYIITIVLGSPTKAKSFEQAKKLSLMGSQKLASTQYIPALAFGR